MDEAAVIARLKACGVVPVVVIEDASLAVDLARALVAGGIDIVEVTLRRPAGLAALAAIARDVPEALAVAGTVVTPAQVQQVKDAGA
ncbi:MAG: keto-deoxy-phosphogluconate aldolase, partial [Bosea sp. (in: a-proteobacteria)]